MCAGGMTSAGSLEDMKFNGFDTIEVCASFPSDVSSEWILHVVESQTGQASSCAKAVSSPT